MDSSAIKFFKCILYPIFFVWSLCMNVIPLAECWKIAYKSIMNVIKHVLEKSFGLQVFELNDSSNKPTHFKLTKTNNKPQIFTQ